MKRTAFWLAIVIVGFLSQGCSVYLAASQPPKVDLNAFAQAGVPRDMIVAKLGTPTSSVRHENGTRTDVYEFYQGSATGWKVGRAAFHAVADVFTLALWEIIGTPSEMAIRGDKVSARAEFDQSEILREFKVMGTDGT